MKEYPQLFVPECVEEGQGSDKRDKGGAREGQTREGQGRDKGRTREGRGRDEGGTRE
jgi:hypothetical protein